MSAGGYQVMVAVDVDAESEEEAREKAFELLFGERGTPPPGFFYWYAVDYEGAA